MASNRANKFSKINHHLKSKQIDEKLELLNEIPVNSTTGMYVVEPEYMVQDPDVEGLPRAVDFTQDALANGRDTTGLFLEDGTILTIEPPGDTSYILGPMASMWYAWGNFTTIGYIRQSDRRMVDLGRITGPLGSWNGTNNFTSYGQLTLAQAQWFKDTPKLNGANNDTPNYRAFYPGPPSNVADQYGRYLCVITGTPKPTSYTPPPRRVPPVVGGPTPNYSNFVPGSANPNVAMDNMGGWLAAAAALGFVFKSVESFINWFNKQSPEMKQKLQDLAKPQEISQYTDDPSTWPSIKNPVNLPPPIIDPKTGWPSVPNIPPSYKGKPGGPSVKLAHYEPQGELISESRQKILKDLKKPYQLPEEKKEKIKYRPRVIGAKSNTINSDLMKQAEVPSSFKQAEERMWTKYNKQQNARWSQERKNQILDHLGGSDHAWEWLTETSKKKNREIMYGNFGGEPSKKKVIRQEQLKGDQLLFIVDENGKQESILQSELSIKIADEMNKELFDKYFQEQETIQADKDPLFRKVKNRLNSVIDYPDKPAKLGYPNDPPPETVNGWHPEYGQKSDYYNKLDPQSADAMPMTGNPEIDAKVRRAKTLKKVLNKKA